MKESPKVIARLVKDNTGNADVDRMLLETKLSEWVLMTRKLLANMGQEYNMIPQQSTTFTRSKLESLKGWEAMLDISDLIVLMKDIKGLILRNYSTK